MNYLALCCIVKDEGPFLSEWFIWHALAGVEHFYIYDNESAVPVKENPVLKKLLQAGRATLHEIAGAHRQYAAYEHCFKTYGAENFWIGALDLDEFVYLARPNDQLRNWLDFRPFLAEFESHAGLALNWSTMGSSGHLTRPEGPVTGLYREKLLGPESSDHHIKTFLRPDCFASVCRNPHNFSVSSGADVVNENHRPIPPERPFFPPFQERAWIYHYFFKSQQDFEIKAARGRADVGMSAEAAAKRYAAFQRHTRQSVRLDERAAALAPLVETWLERGELPPVLPEPDPAKGLEGVLELCNAILTCGNGNADASAPVTQGGQAWADYCKDGEFSLPERFNRAEAVLCRAVPQYGQELPLWVRRARLARQQYRYELAQRYLDKALSLGESFAIYEEWLQLCLARAAQAHENKRARQERLREAGVLLGYMRLQPGDEGEGHAKKMAMYEKMFGKLGGN